MNYAVEVNSIDNLHPDCRQCKWLEVCKGGCPATKFTRTQDFSGKEYTCKSRMQLFEHIATKLKGFETREWTKSFQIPN